MSYLSFDDLAPFALTGFVLNIEERTALQSSLAIKRAEEKFDHVVFWGKINGVNKDYYISQAWQEGEWFTKKSFYCTDLVHWLQFPEVTQDDVARLDQYTGRFLGEPGYEIPLIENTEARTGAEEVGEDGTPPVHMTTLIEEKRLAAVIRQIDNDVHIVPRGAYYRDSLHKIFINNLSQGLAPSELGQLSSYLHFRPGFAVDVKLLNERSEHFQEGIDIFEPISRDEPKGVWSLQVERSGSLSILRSLLWPGYVFYHRPGQQTNSGSQWGSVYYGNGQRNDNVGYML